MLSPLSTWATDYSIPAGQCLIVTSFTLVDGQYLTLSSNGWLVIL